MTDEEEQKLRYDLDMARSANAFLYLALEELAKLQFDMPRLMAQQMTKGELEEADREAFSKSVEKLNEWVKSAHQCIWDEDGKPR